MTENCQKNQSMDESIERRLHSKINGNRFHMLCDNVQSCFSLIDHSLLELLDIKDQLLLQSLPRNILRRITLVLSRFYRTYSQTQIPVYELIHLVQLHSQSFEMKCTVLKRLSNSDGMKSRMLHIALQRLTSLGHDVDEYQNQKCINNWEKMYVRLALPRSNVRKWKFRMQTFREKAILGYEYVIEWLHTSLSRPASPLDISTGQESADDADEQSDVSDEIVSVQDIDEQKSQTNQGSDHDGEVGSDNDGSFHSSVGTPKSEQTDRQSVLSRIDTEVQVQPHFDDQQTSTEDVLSTKSLIMRIYQPTGVLKTTFHCIVHAHGQKYTTKEFSFDKTKKQTHITDSRITKPMDSKTKRSGEILPTSNDIDKQQIDELLIPMFSVHSFVQYDLSSNPIKIDVFADEQLVGSLILSSEDLRLLDLPILYCYTPSPLITIEESIPMKNTPFNFDQTSNNIYNSCISQTPLTFSIYDDKQEPIGQLPLLMFWYHRIESTQATKGTMTVPIVQNEIKEISQVCHAKVTDDRAKTVKATYENEITKIHEHYQAEIQRLTEILNEALAGQSHEMFDISELDEHASPLHYESLSNINIRRQQTTHEVPTNHSQSHIYRRDSPKNFLDRTRMYSERSLIQRHQLVAKVEREIALKNECHMEIQHRLHRSAQQNSCDDFCLPAVFMPFRSGNIFNPKAYQYFHPAGTSGPRITQPPPPPLVRSRSISVLNLFALTRCSNTDKEKDHPSY